MNIYISIAIYLCCALVISCNGKSTKNAIAFEETTDSLTISSDTIKSLVSDPEKTDSLGPFSYRVYDLDKKKWLSGSWQIKTESEDSIGLNDYTFCDAHATAYFQKKGENKNFKAITEKHTDFCWVLYFGNLEELDADFEYNLFFSVKKAFLILDYEKNCAFFDGQETLEPESPYISRYFSPSDTLILYEIINEQDAICDGSKCAEYPPFGVLIYTVVPKNPLLAGKPKYKLVR